MYSNTCFGSLSIGRMNLKKERAMFLFSFVSKYLTVTSSGFKRVIAKRYKALTSSLTISSSNRVTIDTVRLFLVDSNDGSFTERMIRTYLRMICRLFYQQISIHKASHEHRMYPRYRNQIKSFGSWDFFFFLPYRIMSLSILH